MKISDALGIIEGNLKSSWATYVTSNAKSLAYDTARETCSCSQLFNGANGVDLYLCIATTLFFSAL